LETAIGAVIAGNVNNATPAKPTMDSAKLSFVLMSTLLTWKLNDECVRSPSRRNGEGRSVAVAPQESSRMLVTSIRKGRNT
jgi:hypothetical protein